MRIHCMIKKSSRVPNCMMAFQCVFGVRRTRRRFETSRTNNRSYIGNWFCEDSACFSLRVRPALQRT